MSFLNKNILKSMILVLMTGFIGIGNFSLIAQNNAIRNSIVFTVIDNKAQVFVNDKMIYDSGDIAAFDLNTEVDLNEYLTNNAVVKIVLSNSICNKCMTNPWSVSYEIYKNGEFINYIYESGKNGKGVGGEVYSELLDWNNLF